MRTGAAFPCTSAAILPETDAFACGAAGLEPTGGAAEAEAAAAAEEPEAEVAEEEEEEEDDK